MFASASRQRWICAFCAATFCYGFVHAAFAADSFEPSPKIKIIFATSCSWCHDRYGMDAGKGPKLAGTKLSKEGVRNIILNGKSGAMPGYAKSLSEEKIDLLVDYIQSLPAE